jgi:hypothetical protein
MATISFENVLPSSSKAKTLFNLSPEELEQVESRMLPKMAAQSDTCTGTFLAPGERLRDVCLRDLQTLDRIGVSCDQIGDVLEGIIKKADRLFADKREQEYQNAREILRESAAKRARNEEAVLPRDCQPFVPASISGVIVDQRFRVIGGMPSMGFQGCPFSGPNSICHKGRADYTIENLCTREKVKVSQLVIPLIRDHAFFEGAVPYRVDPETLCRVLDIHPDAGL